jgi:hypothetical protein
MDNKIISSNGYKIVEDKMILNFKDAINNFRIVSKGVIKAIINNDTEHIIILKNTEEFEIKDLLVSKVEFIKDKENCIFAKVKYYGFVEV